MEKRTDFDLAKYSLYNSSHLPQLNKWTCFCKKNNKAKMCCFSIAFPVMPQIFKTQWVKPSKMQLGNKLLSKQTRILVQYRCLFNLRDSKNANRSQRIFQKNYPRICWNKSKSIHYLLTLSILNCYFYYYFIEKFL